VSHGGLKLFAHTRAPLIKFCRGPSGEQRLAARRRPYGKVTVVEAFFSARVADFHFDFTLNNHRSPDHSRRHLFAVELKVLHGLGGDTIDIAIFGIAATTRVGVG